MSSDCEKNGVLKASIHLDQRFRNFGRDFQAEGLKACARLKDGLGQLSAELRTAVQDRFEQLELLPFRSP